MGVKRLLGFVILAVAAVVLAACSKEGGSGEATASDSPGVAAAAAAVEEGRQIPTFELDAPSFDASEAAGKKIFIVPLSSAIPFVQELSEEIKTTAESIGVNAFVFNNGGTPTEWSRGINQAIAQRSDAILLVSSPDPRLIVPALRSAKKAGIPVVVGHQYQNGEDPEPEVEDFITATTTAPFNEGARLAVDAAVAQTGEDTKVLILSSSELKPSDGMVESIKSQLAERCPECESTTINIPANEWTSKIRPEVQSALAADPEINWVIPTFDSMSIGAQAGIMGAGRGGQVRIASFNGTADILEMVQKGDIVHSIVGESPAWLAWSMLDQTLRVLTGNEPTEGGFQATPIRLFDDTNIDEVGTPPDSAAGYGDDVFKEGYSELWGVTP